MFCQLFSEFFLCLFEGEETADRGARNGTSSPTKRHIVTSQPIWIIALSTVR